jgi:hypothetical protein
VWIGCPSPDTWAGLSPTLSGQVDVALKEIRIENRSNAEHSGLTFSLATFVIGQLVRTRRMFRPFSARKPFDPHAGQAVAHPNPARNTWIDIKNTTPNIRATILDLCLHAPADIKVR